MPISDWVKLDPARPSLFLSFLGARAPLQLVHVKKKKKRGQKVSKYQLLAISCKLFQECIKVCKYASIQVCNFASMQVCKYASMQVCKYASMQVC